ncbi:polymerase [Porphyromonas macacae]|nr:polymerase [Porphyromonas macacae]
MVFLNYIYFIIISVFSLKLLLQREGKVRSSFDKRRVLLFTGPELFLLLIFATGLLAFSTDLGGLDLMAVRLFVLELFCIIGLYIANRKIGINIPVILYLIYMLWLFIGLFYSPSATYGIRVILKYSYPLLLMLFVSSVVRDEEVFLKSGLYARIVALISLVVILTNSYKLIQWDRFIPGVFWYGTAVTINYISMIVFSLAMYIFYGRKIKDIILAVLFFIPCIVLGFRTSIIGSSAALGLFIFFRYRWKSLPLLLGLFILFFSVLLFSPEVKKKMFLNKDINAEDFMEGKVTIDDINSNGRFVMWTKLLEKHFRGRELLGSGTGSTQKYMYENHVFGGLKVPHNDFVQQLCDNGLIGIVLYLTMALFIISHSFIEYSKNNNIYAVRVSAIVAGVSMGGVLLTMLTDNVVNYSMATIAYPFGFYGMMLGLKRRQKNDISSNSFV